MLKYVQVPLDSSSGRLTALFIRRQDRPHIMDDAHVRDGHPKSPVGLVRL